MRLHPEPQDQESQLHNTIAFLRDTCFLSDSAALQLITYIVHGRAVLGAVPTKTTLIAERFFDEGGGQQLILHAPFGGRLNKAWGLALRKRFCRGFNFELQAAATDNGINISLAEQHSFPLADVFHFLTTLTARELLEQASIPSPLFKNRWRWAAGRSLQLLRMQKGKRVAPQIQRTRSDDLLASVFPHASACPETMTGDIEIPDHPLVREVMKDTLTEAMDLEGLLEVLAGIADGTIKLHRRRHAHPVASSRMSSSTRCPTPSSIPRTPPPAAPAPSAPAAIYPPASPNPPAASTPPPSPPSANSSGPTSATSTSYTTSSSNSSLSPPTSSIRPPQPNPGAPSTGHIFFYSPRRAGKSPLHHPRHRCF